MTAAGLSLVSKSGSGESSGRLCRELGTSKAPHNRVVKKGMPNTFGQMRTGKKMQRGRQASYGPQALHREHGHFWDGNTMWFWHCRVGSYLCPGTESV